MNLLPSEPLRRRALLEVLGVFALSVVLCLAFIGLGKLIPFVERNLHAFVALIFLLLPAWALGRRGEHLEDHGLNTRGLGRALVGAGLAVAVTFPPYVLGHHAWQGLVFHRSLAFEWSNYSAFPEDCQGGPRASAALALWCERDRLWLQWKGPMRIEVRGQGLVVTAGVPRVARPGGGVTALRFAGPGGAGAVRVPPGGEAKIRAWRGAAPLPPAEIGIGPQRVASEQPVDLGRGWLWLLELLLAQLIAVALPEEVFYRGYLQGRLGVVFPRRRRVLGVEVSVGAIVATSVLFALGHFLLDLNPLRLGVFFPALLFGWLRSRTPTLVGAIVFHALCNVLVRVLVVHY